MTRIVALLLGLALLVEAPGCGTILHPERKGQRDGDIDVGIAVLDGIGLLFFIIPGVIAYAVDFSNGTIYLPPRRSRQGGGGVARIREIAFDARRCAIRDVERIVQRELGSDVSFADPSLRVFEMRSRDQMIARFAEAAALIPDQRRPRPPPP